MSVLRYAAVLAILLAGLEAPGSLAQTETKISRMEDKLLAAGFEARPANTPDRQDMLARLPKDKFVRRVNGESIAYVYADPKNCGCLFVGTPQAYGAYRASQDQARLAQDQLEAAREFSDARWNWGAWGPWSGRWASFGFGGYGGW